MNIRKCIIPAAGFGTRFLPATKAQPKEMLPIVDKPVIQYLVEEAVSAGITEIMIVTGRGKRSIEDHFDVSFELEKTLVEKGKRKELSEVERISQLANIAYVRQATPKGDGDALLQASHWVGDEPCLVLFGDDLILGKPSGAKQLIDTFSIHQKPIIALKTVSEQSMHSYGIIESLSQQGKLHTIQQFLEKPQPHETASRLGVIGKYIITPEVFQTLHTIATSQTSKDGEIRLADAFSGMLKHQQELLGLEIIGDRYDTGDKFGFIKATIDFALARPDLGPQVLKFIQQRTK